VPILAYSALAVLVVATVGGAIFAAVRGLDAWRALTSFQRRVEAGTVVLVGGLDGIEAKLVRASESEEGLERSRARLAESLETFGVMTTALRDARASLLLAFLPR
jgi:hypothetical protein